MATPAESDSQGAFRIAAAVLAGTPVGFVAGAVLGRQLMTAESSAQASGSILACALFGALFVGAAMALAAMLLAPKPVRIVTLIAGAVSFVVVFFMVCNFISARMARAEALEAALQSMPRFELSLTTEAVNRRPFSSLVYESQDRTYDALRPNGWRCEGKGNREQTLALYRALRQVQPAEAGSDCAYQVSWRINEGEPMQGCADGNDQLLFSVADAMVEDTQRRSSCRRSR